MKTIKLPVCKIVVNITEDGGGSITSNMKESVDTVDSDEAEETIRFNSAVDGLEAIILAHATAGVNIASPKYVEGICTAYEHIGNHASELGK